MSKIKRLRAVLTGVVVSTLAAATLPVLAATATAATDPLGGQPGPVTLAPTMSQDGWQPTPPAGTTVDDFMRHPVLSWTAVTTLPVTIYRVQISPNANFTNNTVALPNGGLTTSTEYDLPQTLPHASYFWRVRGEDTAGHATNWAGTSEGNLASTWQFTKTWIDQPGNLSPANNGTATNYTVSWSPIPDASAYQLQLSTNPSFLKGADDPAWTDSGPCGTAGNDCTVVAPWDSVTTYNKTAKVAYGGHLWTATRPTSGETPTSSTLTLFTCSTNNTSFTPYVKESLDGGLSLQEGTVAEPCDDPGKLADALDQGGLWYWRVRGLDGTSAGATAAQANATCFTDTTDCGPWSPSLRINFPIASVTVPPAGVVTNLTVNCPNVVPGGSVPLCLQTPTMSWSPVAGANGYWVDVSADPMFAGGYHSYLTAGPQVTPRDSYADNQAGRSYYWRVQACAAAFADSLINCNPATAASAPTSVFHKASSALPKDALSAASTTGHNGLYVTVDNNETFSGAVKTVRTQQMTFHWDDLLQYQQQAGIAANQEAKEYRLEYSTTGNWLDDTSTTTVTTDATHWTKIDGPLADGGYYWRVAPVDGSGNLLSWSGVQTVVKGTVAPTVAIADAGLLAPTSAVTLQFQAPVSGVTSATLGLKRVGGGIIAGHIVWPAPTPSLATFTPDQPLLPGEKVVPWVTSGVVDLAGNAAKASTTSSTVDPTVDSVATIVKETWSKVSTGHASGGSYAKAAGARDEIDFRFTGSAVKLIGVRSADSGYAVVSVDGVTKKTVNLYSAKTSYGVVLYSALLAEGKHVVTVTVKGSHPAKSKGNAVGVDGLKVDGRMLQQSSADQHWSRHRSTDAMNGSYDAESSYLSTWHASKPTLTTKFASSAVRVIGCKSPDAGKFGVYVDGKLKATVDAFQKFTSCNKTLVRVKGLSSAVHTVTVVPLGIHNKNAKGTKVAVDAIVAG